MVVSVLAVAAGPLLSGCVGHEGGGSDRGSGYGEGVGNEQGAYQDDDEISGDHFWRAHNRE